MKRADLKLKICIVIAFSVFTVKALGQGYKYTYYLNADLASVPKDKAILIGRSYMQNNRWILDCFLVTTGKKIITAGVKDSTLSELYGPFKSYYANGRIESEGAYNENEMNGVWKYWDEDGFVTDSMIYDRGIRTAYGSYTYYFKSPTYTQLLFSSGLKDTLYAYRYSFTDSLKNTFTEKHVSLNGEKVKIDFEADFIGERGLLKEYDSAGKVKSDSVFTRKLQEASFPGGEDAWRNFLRQNLNPKVPVDNHAPGGKYTLVVKFIVNPDGTLTDMKAESDPGFGMVGEAIRVMRKSNKWQPAIKYGKYQRAYRRQPITFLIEE